MRYALLIDRVVSAAEGDDARPGNGKAVGLDTILFQKLYILSPELVRVSGDVTIASIEGAAWLPGEGIPDARATAVDARGTFNLEGGCAEVSNVNESARGCAGKPDLLRNPR